MVDKLRVVQPTQNLCWAHLHVGAVGYSKRRQPQSGKIGRQPTALYAFAKAPGGGGFGFVTPEEPALILLERQQLGGGITAVGGVLLEAVHVIQGMVERSFGPQ